MEQVHFLEIKVDPSWLDAVANRCFEIGLLGIETYEENEKGCIRTYCLSKAQARQLAGQMKEYLASLAALWPDSEPFRVEIGQIKEIDWANAWKASFKPTEVIDNLVIRPSWEIYKPKKQEIVITIDPKMAFGTGKHETTTLALEAIKRISEEYETSDAVLLDVGSGTGILCLAANFMGIARTMGIDIDAEAVRCSAENSQINGLADRAVFINTTIDKIFGLFDFVVANIDAKTLIPLAPEVKRVFSGSGRVILTGILETQGQKVETAFRQAGFIPADVHQLGEWILLEMEIEEE